MHVLVMNRNQAVEQSYIDFASTKAIISISTPGDEPAAFNLDNNSIVDILHIQCFDVESNDERFELGYELKPTDYFTNDDARKVKDFVLKYKDRVECMWVHCDAGVSRSAGVAAAILKALTGDDSKIFDNPNYYPNMLCYRKTLESFL